jgi:hypothetical protein
MTTPRAGSGDDAFMPATTAQTAQARFPALAAPLVDDALARAHALESGSDPES